MTLLHLYFGKTCWRLMAVFNSFRSAELCGKALKKCFCQKMRCSYFYIFIFPRAILTCDVFQVTQRINNFDNALGSLISAVDESEFDAVRFDFLAISIPSAAIIV